jgi:hypothetical protein
MESAETMTAIVASGVIATLTAVSISRKVPTSGDLPRGRVMGMTLFLYVAHVMALQLSLPPKRQVEAAVRENRAKRSHGSFIDILLVSRVCFS